MKRYTFNGILTGFALCLLFTSTATAANSRILNPVIVTVNGEKITENQVDKLIEKEIKMAMSFGQKPSRAVRHNLMVRTLDQIIEKILINERVKAKRIVVSKKEVDQAIEKIARSKNMSVKRFFDKALPAYNTSINEFMDRVTMGLRFDKLLETVSGPNAFKVSDREAKRYYTRHKDQFTKPARVRASHIMIKYPGKDKESIADVKFAMGKIAEMAKKGKDFAELAKKYSEDKASRAKGGDLGFFVKETMPPKIAEAAFSLKAGGISKVIAMPYGCHLVKVFAVDEGGLVSFEKVKADIVAWIVTDTKDRTARNYVENLRARARITWTSGKAPEPIMVDDSQQQW